MEAETVTRNKARQGRKDQQDEVGSGIVGRGNTFFFFFFFSFNGICDAKGQRGSMDKSNPGSANAGAARLRGSIPCSVLPFCSSTSLNGAQPGLQEGCGGNQPEHAAASRQGLALSSSEVSVVSSRPGHGSGLACLWHACADDLEGDFHDILVKLLTLLVSIFAVLAPNCIYSNVSGGTRGLQIEWRVKPTARFFSLATPSIPSSRARSRRTLLTASTPEMSSLLAKSHFSQAGVSIAHRTRRSSR